MRVKEEEAGIDTPAMDWKLMQFILCCASVIISAVVKNIYTAFGSLKASQVIIAISRFA